MLLIPVCDSKQIVSIIAIFTSPINLQLNAEIPLRIAVEYRLWLVAIVVNRTIPVNFIVITLGAVVVSIKVISIVLMKQCIAAGAASIVVFLTVTAKRGIFVTVAIICPYNLTAAVAG